MIVTVLILALPIISLQHPVSVEEEVKMNDLTGKYIQLKQDAKEAFALVDKIYDLLKNYECARNQDDCTAWQAWRIGDAIVKGQINCDDTPENKFCKKARALHGLSESSSHQETFDGLVDLGEGVSPADMKSANDVIDAAVSFVCNKEPEKCSAVRYLVKF